MLPYWVLPRANLFIYPLLCTQGANGLEDRKDLIRWGRVAPLCS
jgi:hypothetical protein